MNENEIKRWQKRVKAFLDTNNAAHIVLQNGTWLNGYLSKVFDDYFVIVDREDGEVPVFFADLKVFDFYRGDMSKLKQIEVNNG